MIISKNRMSPLYSFQQIMDKTDKILNEDASRREEYYVKRSGKSLEKDVYAAVCEASKGTDFEGTIQLVSGASFPDIIANKFYGIEVKSTEKNRWTSIGSSILESTRNVDVQRIYLTFGKLGKPVQFLSRPYEDCLSGIAVTHYPRYQIDMRLKEGETIFDKMGISYDALRSMENPVVPVSQYYKSKLKPGESLWWASSDINAASPVSIKLWNVLSHEEKEILTIQGYALFPEILSGGNNKKYNRYALWLASRMGVVNTNVRDSFSAGGKVEMINQQGSMISMPAAFGRIQKYSHLIAQTIYEIDEEVLKEYWQVDDIWSGRVKQWCDLVARTAQSHMECLKIWDVLSCVFPEINK